MQLISFLIMSAHSHGFYLSERMRTLKIDDQINMDERCQIKTSAEDSLELMGLAAKLTLIRASYFSYYWKSESEAPERSMKSSL
ncbi:hypothetical protein A3K70_03160 [Candidatus Bathyarchaeota archaeon RBG_16_48_13]|nr:MAG: hypothetical protein A3K70_03160 [Candidatus Bathyarchaeota archaeon RBG_16_48_13]